MNDPIAPVILSSPETVAANNARTCISQFLDDIEDKNEIPLGPVVEGLFYKLAHQESANRHPEVTAAIFKTLNEIVYNSRIKERHLPCFIAAMRATNQLEIDQSIEQWNLLIEALKSKKITDKTSDLIEGIEEAVNTLREFHINHPEKSDCYSNLITELMPLLERFSDLDHMRLALGKMCAALDLVDVKSRFTILESLYEISLKRSDHLDDRWKEAVIMSLAIGSGTLDSDEKERYKERLRQEAVTIKDVNIQSKTLMDIEIWSFNVPTLSVSPKQLALPSTPFHDEAMKMKFQACIDEGWGRLQKETQTTFSRSEALQRFLQLQSSTPQLKRNAGHRKLA